MEQNDSISSPSSSSTISKRNGLDFVPQDFAITAANGVTASSARKRKLQSTHATVKGTKRAQTCQANSHGGDVSHEQVDTPSRAFLPDPSIRFPMRDASQVELHPVLRSTAYAQGPSRFLSRMVNPIQAQDPLIQYRSHISTYRQQHNLSRTELPQQAFLQPGAHYQVQQGPGFNHVTGTSRDDYVLNSPPQLHPGNKPTSMKSRPGFSTDDPSVQSPQLSVSLGLAQGLAQGPLPPLGFVQPPRLVNPEVAALQIQPRSRPFSKRTPGGNPSLKLYQVVRDFALDPTKLSGPLSDFHFSIPESDFARVSRDKTARRTDVRSCKFKHESLQYRLRCIEIERHVGIESRIDWIVSDTNWPERTSLSINSNYVEIPSKVHYGKDLPIDISLIYSSRHFWIDHKQGTITTEMPRLSAETRDR
ncbi:hypothetical protein IFR05_016179 [Cadophora sp. M221]|nr:hypothetical protein IFR05_016179 [Cadophora sp. M221]